MTDKERLEEIKKLRETILEENDFRTRCVLANVFVSLGYIDYLIKQAERVHGKNNLIGLAGMYEDCNRMVANLTSQNKRYREVIKKAIDDLENECLWDALMKLKALEGEE